MNFLSVIILFVIGQVTGAVFTAFGVALGKSQNAQDDTERNETNNAG